MPITELKRRRGAAGAPPARCRSTASATERPCAAAAATWRSGRTALPAAKTPRAAGGEGPGCDAHALARRPRPPRPARGARAPRPPRRPSRGPRRRSPRPAPRARRRGRAPARSRSAPRARGPPRSPPPARGRAARPRRRRRAGSPRGRVALEQRAGVPALLQEERRRQPGRPGAGDRDAPAARRGRGRHPGVAQVGVGHGALEQADRDGAVVPAAAAGVLAGHGADVRQRPRERDPLLEGAGGGAPLPRAGLPDEQRHVDARGTAAAAGGLAVADVVAQQQLDRRAPRLAHLGPVGLDLHPRRGRARRTPAAAGRSRARARRRRGTRPTAPPPRARHSVGISTPSAAAASQQRPARGGLDLPAVDADPHGAHAPAPVSTATAPTGQTWRQTSQRVQAAASISCGSWGRAAIAAAGSAGRSACSRCSRR